MFIIYIGWILVALGLFSILSGIIGLFRFRGFYQKLHAASLIESFGVPTSLLGLAFLSSSYIVILKLLLIILLILLLGPVNSYALSRASIPYKTDSSGRLL